MSSQVTRQINNQTTKQQYTGVRVSVSRVATIHNLKCPIFRKGKYETFKGTGKYDLYIGRNKTNRSRNCLQKDPNAMYNRQILKSTIVNMLKNIENHA